MRNHPKTLLGLLALSAFLAGCGGGGSSSSPSAGTRIPVSGGATLLNRNADTQISSTSNPVTATFGDTTANVPANTAIPAGPVAILTTTTPLLSMQGTGNLTVNGQGTGVSLANGSLSAHLALPPTTGSGVHMISGVAPAGGFVLGTGLTTLKVNGTVQIGAPVTSAGAAGIPTAITGLVPANGSTTSAVQVNATYPTVFSGGYLAKLTISWTKNGVTQTITQTRNIPVSGVVAFSPSSGGRIPATGVDTLKIELIAN